MAHTLDYLYETVQAGSQERSYWHHPAVVLVPAKHVDLVRDQEARARAAQARAAAEQARADEERERWAKNIEALYLCQRDLLPTAAEAAARAARSGETIWLGVPPTAVGPTLVGTAWADAMTGEIIDAGAATALDTVSLEQAYGNDKTAFGAIVWLGPHKNALRLFAVICPVASRITPGLASSWHRRGVRVNVREEREAHRVAESLGWPVTSLCFIPAGAAGRGAAPSQGSSPSSLCAEMPFAGFLTGQFASRTCRRSRVNV